MADTRVARQFWIRAPRHGEIVTADLPPRQAGEVLVRTLFSGISRGTEALVFAGQVPVSQREVMRAPFQDGEFPGPVKFGYMSVGEVLEGPDDLRGRFVFCLFPHQDLYCVPDTAVTLLPQALPAGRAILTANMETAINAVWDATPTVGDRVVVIGAGVVGLLIAWLCRQIPGARVTTVDINPARRTVADVLGLELLTSPSGLSDNADLVFHASGQPEGLVNALHLLGAEGTVIEVSWYGSRMVSLPLGEAFHSRRLTIRSSQVGRIPVDRQPRWTHHARLALALDLLREPAFDALITGESNFDVLPEVLARLSEAPGDTLCHRIRYPVG